MAANSSTFTSFYNDWLARQESLLRRLDTLISPEDVFDSLLECREVIPTVLSHYHEFFREKAKVAAEDVFLALSPPWLSSFELSLLWLTGFRPSMLFPIINASVAGELTAEQKGRVEEVRVETRRREKEIEEAMARVQEMVAEPPVHDLMKNFGKLVDGEVTELEKAMEELKAAMLVEVENADNLRGWTVAEMVKILSPVHAVKVLAAASRFQLQARIWGKRKDAERNDFSR